DWLAFELALWLGPRITAIWPLSRHPGLIEKATSWFARWGVAAIFFGRFFGPLRAAVPLVAGISRMKRLGFQLANVASAFVWAAGILTPGMVGLPWLFS